MSRGRIAALAAGLLLTPLGMAEGRIAPPPLIARADDQFVRAARGSYCWFEGGTGLCADYGYPLPIRSRLPVSGGARIALRIGAPARRVEPTLLRVDGAEVRHFDLAIRARPITERRRRWWVRLPQNLRGSNVLDVFVRYVHRGDADFWVGLR